MDLIEQRFHAAMLGIYDEAKRRYKYNATYFLRLVSEQGGVQAAHHLLATQDHVQSGFTRLWEVGRLDLTVESLVLREEFASLFSEDERAIAQARLQAYSR